MLFSSAELLWLEKILYERFGCKFELTMQVDQLKLTLIGHEASIYFDQLQEVFHRSSSDFPCYQWQALSEGFSSAIEDTIPAPSEVELPSPLVEWREQGAVVHYDILGLSYWMLTRLEEIGRSDLDDHFRFPAVSSHAYKHNYLERPIVDEWLFILGQVIKRIWPRVSLKQHSYKVMLSHDVDSPSLYAFKTWYAIGRMMAGHLLKRHNFKAFVIAPYVKLSTRKKLSNYDPHNTFDWLMDVSESNNIKSAFYFICGRTDRLRDADYEPDHQVIRGLMRRVHERGHELGLHPSYNTYLDPGLLKGEAQRLKNICEAEDIEQREWGGRMHYLRWQQSTTMRAWADAGLDYDATMGYADRPGFRCGSCWEYTAFDPLAQEVLDLKIRPLIVMECTVIDKIYLGLGVGRASEDKINLLKERCRQVGGGFGILWHNSYLMSSKLKVMYKSVIGS